MNLNNYNMKKYISFVLTLGNIAFTLISLHMSYKFYDQGNMEQCAVTLFFSAISFILYTQLSKRS
jgi:hypothetical protein